MSFFLPAAVFGMLSGGQKTAMLSAKVLPHSWDFYCVLGYLDFTARYLVDFSSNPLGKGRKSRSSTHQTPRRCRHYLVR